MGAAPGSAVVSIGAIVFDPRYGKVSNQTFHRELDWEDQERHIWHKISFIKQERA